MRLSYPVRKRFSILTAVLALVLLTAAPVFCAGGGGHGDEGTKGWVATDTYKVMNFTVLAVALIILLRKPAAKALNARIEGIKEQLEELEAKKGEAEKQLAEYNEKLSQLDKEAETIVANYIKQGEEAKARIIEEAKSTADKLEEQAKRAIEHEFKQAKEKLKAEVSEEALAKAEALIKEKITSEDQEKLVDEYLEKVVA
jgi:F-type H+-transporting ATPase subunit b